MSETLPENSGQAVSEEMDSLFGTILDASPDMLCLFDCRRNHSPGERCTRGNSRLSRR